MGFGATRRPAVDVLRDIRLHGGDLTCDPLTGELLAHGDLPPWLLRELYERKDDLRALSQEHDSLHLRVVYAAEAILDRRQRRRAKATA